MESESAPANFLRDFLHVIFKRRIQILLVFGVIVSVAAIASFGTKPTYKASAQLLVKIGRENIYVPTPSSGGADKPVITLMREEEINSEIQILKSHFLAERVVQSLGHAVIYPGLNSTGQGVSPLQRAVLRFAKGLEIEGVRKSNVINVSFKHNDPQMAARGVNTLISLYLDHHLDIHKSPHSYKFFGEQSEVLKKKLKRAEENQKTFKKTHALTSLEEERKLVLMAEADLHAALGQTVSQEAETQNQLQQTYYQLSITPKTIPLDEVVDHNPLTISTLQARLIDLELKEHELLSKYANGSRIIQSVREAIQMVRHSLADQEGKRHGKSRTGMNPVHRTLQRQIFESEAHLKALKGRKEIQRAQLASHKKKLEKFNRLEMEYERLHQEVEINRENYRLYRTKFEESRISIAMDTEKITNVSVIEPARPPIAPMGPKILLNMLVAIVLGGVGALGLAYFSDYLNDTVEKDEDVENYLRLPLLASIPALKR